MASDCRQGPDTGKALVTDVISFVEAVVKATAKGASEAAVRDAVQESLGPVAAAAAVSLAGASVSEFAVVVLRLIARVSDSTQKKLELLISAPMAAGLAEVETAVAVEVLTPDDVSERVYRLRMADRYLSEAFALVRKSEADARSRALIHLVRAFCATSTGAYGFALHHLARAREEFATLARAIAEEKAQFLSDMSRFPTHRDPHGRVSTGGRELARRESELVERAADLTALQKLCGEFLMALEASVPQRLAPKQD